ncbi:putative membrane protein [Asticcacaulis biprosthecium C19]|uniref:Putative membrane protein n=1 Tax=Asticcacaulis biprosthecium C19 TaxID=715226 RepID=F4QI52_9CAUL|nr:hypothetical protein [Asticcacaulis biprosthecium]EGF92919.1 putative membrane protein [Asticcacaulis biprosthecium C19]
MSEAPTPAKPALFSVVALMVIVGLVLAIAIAKKTGLIEAGAAAQYAGSLFSLLMIGAGNVLPKRAIAPQTASRFAGWILVLGGLASLGMWLLAPEDMRIALASATALSAFAVAILAAAMHVKAGSPAGGRAHTAILQILNGLMWAFAMFLADFAIGGQSVLWLTAGFTVSMSLLEICLRGSAKKSA